MSLETTANEKLWDRVGNMFLGRRDNICNSWVRRQPNLFQEEKLPEVTKGSVQRCGRQDGGGRDRREPGLRLLHIQDLLISNCFYLLLAIILNMLRVTDLAGIQRKFPIPKRFKMKFLGAMGLRSLQSPILLTSWQKKQSSVLKQRQTYIKRPWLHQEPVWSNPPHSTALRKTSRKTHLKCNSLRCCKKGNAGATETRVFPLWEWATRSWRETCLFLFNWVSLGPFIHETPVDWILSKVREKQVHPPPWKTSKWFKNNSLLHT